MRKKQWRNRKNFSKRYTLYAKQKKEILEKIDDGKNEELKKSLLSLKKSDELSNKECFEISTFLSILEDVCCEKENKIEDK